MTEGPRALGVVATAAAAFCLVLIYLALQMRAGADPAIGAGPQAPAAAPPQVIVRRVIVTRVVEEDGAAAPGATGRLASAPASAAPAAAAPAPAAVPAPAPAPAPVVSRGS